MKKNGFYAAMILFVIAGAIASYAAVTSLLGAAAPDPDPDAQLVHNEPEVKLPVTEPEPPAEPVEPEPAPVMQPEESEPVSSAPDPLIPVYTRPVSGAVSQPFSGTELVKSETMNDWRTHNGADYTAAMGEQVLAVYSGEITRAEYDPLLGNLVELKLDTGYHALYANLAAFDGVEVGQRVSQGDVLGAVGDSALIERAELPHLHFELRSGDKRVDPETLF